MRHLDKGIASWTLAVLLAWAGAHADDCTKDDVMQIVNQAASILEQEGEAGLAKVGELRFCGDNYVFVNTMDGVTVMHIHEHLIGRNLLHLRDDTGKHFFSDFADTARTQTSERDGKEYYSGTGWVRYRWPRPGEQEFTPKVTYIRGVLMGDVNVYVGAGIDDD